MFVIRRLPTTDSLASPGKEFYLFGNKTFTNDLDLARTFDSWNSANSHIKEWFMPGLHIIEEISND